MTSNFIHSELTHHDFSILTSLGHFAYVKKSKQKSRKETDDEYLVTVYERFFRRKHPSMFSHSQADLNNHKKQETYLLEKRTLLI